MLDANLESFENLRQNLEANEIDPDEIPIVFQFNKRDLPNALPIEIMNERLNPRNYPFYEAIALKGVGVEETLKGVTKLVFKSLVGQVRGGNPAGAAGFEPRAFPGPHRGLRARPGAPPRERGPASAARKGQEAHRHDSSRDRRDSRRPPRAPRPRRGHGDNSAGRGISRRSRPSPPPPARAVKMVDATMISNRGEASALRRHIANPAAPEFELNLEEIEEEEEEVEEISLEATPLPSLDDLVPPVAVPPPARPMAPSGRASPAATAPRPLPAPAVRAGAAGAPQRPLEQPCPRRRRKLLSPGGRQGRGGRRGDAGLGAHRDRHRPRHHEGQPEPPPHPERQAARVASRAGSSVATFFPAGLDAGSPGHYPIIRIKR